MNKNQLARLDRHRKVKKVLAEQAAAVASVPAFADLAAEFLSRLALLDGTARRNPVTSEGATLAKGGASAALVKRLVKAANALYLLYKKEGNQEEAAKMHRNPTDYRNMSEIERATEAQDLSQRVTARATSLSAYNVAAADVAALATDAASFDAMLADSQLAIDTGKIKGATAAATLSALNIFLKDDLRAGMELLKDTQPEAYKALREASQVDDAAYRKKPVKPAGKGGAATPELPAPDPAA